MLTKEEIAVAFGYTINERGTITSPGKFEGEPWWAVALWEMALEGFADDTLDEDDGGPTDLFTVDEELIERFALPADWEGHTIGVYEDDFGFVRVLGPAGGTLARQR